MGICDSIGGKAEIELNLSKHLDAKLLQSYWNSLFSPNDRSVPYSGVVRTLYAFNKAFVLG
jgi:hypothetical protein